ncbi:hexokinase A [Chytridiales sp. JEL 0842]|nr:hexokinase A [Chytridiales sp. JEL 0842]
MAAQDDASAGPTPVAATPKNDRLERLHAKVKKAPWDVDVWSSYIQEACLCQDPIYGREAYEAFLKQFPTSYIDFELKWKASERIDDIFNRCLRSVMSIDIWKCYLNYIRRKHTDKAMSAEEKVEAKAVISSAFELVLSNVGFDKDSGSIWSEYLHFVKTSEVTTSYEEQLRMETIRKLYHRALVVPLNNIESLWKEYDSYENNLNKLTAKKLLSEKSAGYMSARSALRELKGITSMIDGVQRTWYAVPPTWSSKEHQLLQAWKKWINWEKSNPLHLDDTSVVISRVSYVYKLAMSMMRHFPEIWLDAAAYFNDVNRPDEAVKLLSEACEIMPQSILVIFAYVELLETQKRPFSDIAQVFDGLITVLDKSLVDTNAKYDAERESMMAAFKQMEEALEKDSGEWDGERREREREKKKDKEQEIEAKVETARKRDVKAGKEAWSLAHIVYMRVARRVEGIRSARNVFKVARRSENSLMEYYCSKDVTVACKIFEAGIKAFTDEESLMPLMLKYLDFLISLNDENNSRALFERALVSLSPAQARLIWDRFLIHEREYGELPNILKTEKRWMEANKDGITADSVRRQLALRWSFMDIQYVRVKELGLPELPAGMFIAGIQDTSATVQADLTADPNRETKADTNGSANGASEELQQRTKYPRPDLGKWNLYKPDLQSSASSGHSQGQANAGGAAGVGVGGAGAMTTLMIPEAINSLLQLLAPAQQYNGPTINVDEIVEILKQLPIPAPAITPVLVPVQVAVSGISGTGGGAVPSIPPPGYQSPTLNGGSSSSMGRRGGFSNRLVKILIEVSLDGCGGDGDGDDGDEDDDDDDDGNEVALAASDGVPCVAISAIATFLTTAFLRSARRAQPQEVVVVAKPPLSHGNSLVDVTSETISRLEALFNVPADKLNLIVKHMVAEMKKGLSSDNHALKMIPSHVVRRPTGSETGSFLALDLGGSNFRVCEVILDGNGIARSRQRKYTVSDQLKTGSGTALFDFFADCVAAFLQDIGSPEKERKLGFTFSFPVQQTSIKHGYLMKWTKGFSASNVENVDVVNLLQEAFVRKNINVKVTALVNDTTGTLMSHAYSQPNTYIGVILGTGSNAAYVESMENIVKFSGDRTPKEMIINTEWGAFDDEQIVLPRTKYDVKLDRASANPRQQTFEKMISGMYLGEIVRYVLIDLIKTGEVFSGRRSDVLAQPFSFETAYMSRIERDHTLDLSDTKTVLEEFLKIPLTSRADRLIVRTVCELVGKRAARLSAAGVAAIVTKINRLDGCTVAVDGSLFELYPHFANRMRDALRELLGMSSENVILEQARDGSGQGAALIAALADH